MREDLTTPAILKLLDDMPGLTSAQLSELMGAHPSTVIRSLTNATKRGDVLYTMVGKARSYTLNTEGLPPMVSDRRGKKKGKKTKGSRAAHATNESLRTHGARVVRNGSSAVREGDMAKVVWVQGREVRLITASGGFIRGELV